MAVTKRKTPSVKTLKAKLDRVFSVYIRIRDSDHNGYCKCISCGKIEHYKQVDCGHYVNRSHMSTRYNERNCNAQYRSCNRFDEGNNIGYTKGLINKYGIKIINDLDILKHSHSHLSAFDYQIMIEHYIKETKKLCEEKRISI